MLEKPGDGEARADGQHKHGQHLQTFGGLALLQMFLIHDGIGWNTCFAPLAACVARSGGKWDSIR